MPSSLGIYPIQDPITDGNGNLTPSWERVLRGIFTNTQGSVKPVGQFVVQGSSVTIPANTLRVGSTIDIVAEYGGAATVGTVTVALGGVTLVSVGFGPALANAKVIIRANVIIAAGALNSFCTFSSTDSGGISTMGINGFTPPDMTQSMTVTVTTGTQSNFLSVITHT